MNKGGDNMSKLIVLDMIMASEGITRQDIRDMRADIADSWARRHNGEELNVILGSTIMRRSGEEGRKDPEQIYTF